MSEEATRSEWIRFEIGRAWGARKMIFPIQVGGANLPSDLAGFVYVQVESPKLSDEDEQRVKVNLGRLLETLRAN
jgi:hypothetical protein